MLAISGSYPVQPRRIYFDMCSEDHVPYPELGFEISSVVIFHQCAFFYMRPDTKALTGYLYEYITFDDFMHNEQLKNGPSKTSQTKSVCILNIKCVEQMII